MENGISMWKLQRKLIGLLAILSVLTRCANAIKGANSVVLFYFQDAYSDIGEVVTELRVHQQHTLGIVVAKGISGSLLEFNASRRFLFVFLFIGSFGTFVLALIWSNKIWANGALKNGITA